MYIDDWCYCNANCSCSHKYQQLPLIPVEEFLAQNPDRANDDENELMYARIEHERAEREDLEQKRQELLKRKQKLIAENKRRKDDLANLDQDLEKFIDVRLLALLYCRGSRLFTNNNNCRPPNPSWNCLKRRLERRC